MDRFPFQQRISPPSVRVIGFAALLAVTALVRPAPAANADAVAHFKKDVQPLLVNYCYDCHGDGEEKGKVAFDGFASAEALVDNRDLWLKVLKNVRAGLMPPARKSQPTADQRRTLEQWIKYKAFGIDPEHPDPGRVTLRRLNRVEYRNTIRDLMGVDYKTEEEFPPDDTGYGFDNIGDVLTISPLLLEKYMQAAETIVAQAVPVTSRVVREATIPGSRFRRDDNNDGEPDAPRGDDNDDEPRGRIRESRSVSFYKKGTVIHTHRVDEPGSYYLTVELNVRGDFDFDPGKCNFAFKVDGRELLKQEFGWHNGKTFKFEFDEKWDKGERQMSFELEPLTPVEQRKNNVDMRIVSVQVRGPTEREKWGRPGNFHRFFTMDVPEGEAERRDYAREVLAKFASKAFRRPVDEKTVDRLVAIAEAGYTAPDKTFEQGVGQAIVAVLASPRFLFRIEGLQPDGGSPKSHPLVDEYALASRLSYFLWSTMPDEELTRLASAGELRKNLPDQVKRMLADRRAEALVENFAGQWLQTRDVEGISIDARSVLSRDEGNDKELQELFARLRELRAKREEETRKLIQEGKPVQERQRSPEEEQLRERLRAVRRGPMIELDGPLRQAMRRETEMFFEHLLRENRTVLDLLDSDYTFLNERLAKHYGIEGVKGEQMRRVDLPEGNPRGGLLTQGSVLVVTSNPTRTSPVKRGLFVLENILGTPTPPPPPDIPELEAAEKDLKGKEPTLRNVLEQHRSNALCSSCHNRMDPLGLALENFNALGMWREKERKQPIDSAGKLITGESFDGVRGLKKILRNERRQDFYRCLTEKLMTYALGRGLEYHDVEAVDRIVARLEKEEGRFDALMTGVVESTPFQKRRNPAAPAPPGPDEKTQRADRS
jgi:hypothetical protein